MVSAAMRRPAAPVHAPHGKWQPLPPRKPFHARRSTVVRNAVETEVQNATINFHPLFKRDKTKNISPSPSIFASLNPAGKIRFRRQD